MAIDKYKSGVGVGTADAHISFNREEQSDLTASFYSRVVGAAEPWNFAFKAAIRFCSTVAHLRCE